MTPAPTMKPTGKRFTWKGKCSTFGGPDDTGVAPDEGLALIEPAELKKRPDLAKYFLPTQPHGTTGLARRLNPAENYLAVRWDYKATPRSQLTRVLCLVKNAKTGNAAFARPLDWGPNTRTRRVADLSPGLAKILCLKTDDEVEITLELLA